MKEPIIPLHLFKIRTLAYVNIVGFFMSAGLFGAIVYNPLFVQGVIGVKSSISGYVLTPLMLSVTITSIVGESLGDIESVLEAQVDLTLDRKFFASSTRNPTVRGRVFENRGVAPVRRRTLGFDSAEGRVAD